MVLSTAQAGRIEGLKVCKSNDIHAQAALLDTWDQEYCQLSCGQFSGSVVSTWAGDVRFFVEKMNRAVLQRGCVGSDRIGIGLPIRLPGKSNLCGEAVEPLSLLVFSGQSGFEFLSPGEFLFVGMEIRSRPQQDPRLAGLIKTLRRALYGRRRVVPIGASEASALATSLVSVVNQLTKTPELLRDEARMRTLQASAMGMTIDCICEAEAEEQGASPSDTNYWQLINQIHDLVVDLPDCPLSVAELADRLGVSRRTVQYACNRALDLNPVAYLRALRLSGLRRDIRHADSVTEVATRWGFWHFGYLARDYKAMFGELPSTTLKRESLRI
ncbi:MAG: helix-turn-helix domain-containing protein [Kiloniellales bacterium]